MKWCCLAFEGRYGEAGKRGLAILVEPNIEGKPHFVLQYRAIDMELERVMKAEAPISLVSEVRIQYCPWCGRNLSGWYGGDAEGLARAGFLIRETQK